MTDDGFYLEKPDGVHWYCNDLVETGQHMLYGCGGRGIGKHIIRVLPQWTNL